MRFRSSFLVGIFILTSLVASTAFPTSNQQANAKQSLTRIRNNFTNSTLESKTTTKLVTVSGPTSGSPVAPGVSPAVRDLPKIQSNQANSTSAARARQNWGRRPAYPQERTTGNDPLYTRAPAPATALPDPVLSFEGISNTGYVPPDTNGDVGPNHYIQMVNVSFAIFDKSGNLLAGPTPVNELWNGQGNSCEYDNDGDPIVLYDPLADRWMLTQFALDYPYHMCVAVSQTPDPLGAYYLYAFQVPDFPDYPKFAVWPDAYYLTTNESNAAVYAFDRSKILNGEPATYVRFTTNGNFMLPGDLDGSMPPPDGSPAYVYTMMDDTFWGAPQDELDVWEFHVDFVTPNNSTFTQVAELPTTEFIYTVCGWFNFQCIHQPSPGELVDAISEWPMWRFVYRNFGDHETLLGNFTIDVDNTDHAGIRWFELRKSGGSWSIYQEGTQAPDQHSRWLGSIAMDKFGNIALGYSVSSTTLKPAIRYAVRTPSDPPGTLQPETTLIAGNGVQTNGYNRWGDYSGMSVDPVDDCTFWYTNEYYPVDAPRAWHTQVGAFRLPSCGGVALNLGKSFSNPEPLPGELITVTISIDNSGGISATNGLVSDVLPTGILFAGPITLNPPDAGTPGDNPPILASDLTIEPGQGITVSFPVTVSAELDDGAVITNTASVTSTEIITPVLGSAVLTVTYKSDLAIEKTGPPDPIEIQHPFNYLLTVTNNGPVTGTNVILTDTLPITGTVFQDASSSKGSCDETGGLVVCSFGDLSASEIVTASITLTPTISGVITNTASVASDSIDPALENNTASTTTEVFASADLSIASQASPDPVTAGELLTYTLTVTNLGPSAATGIVLTDTMPLSTTLVSSSPECIPTAGNLVCSTENISSGDSVGYTFIVQVAEDASDALINEASLTSDVFDSDLSNNETWLSTGVIHKTWTVWLPVLIR